MRRARPGRRLPDVHGVRMKIYLVGGAVRDGLLGDPVGERDWVVVGGDVGGMRAQGYVAADRLFPVKSPP